MTSEAFRSNILQKASSFIKINTLLFYIFYVLTFYLKLHILDAFLSSTIEPLQGGGGLTEPQAPSLVRPPSCIADCL